MGLEVSKGCFFEWHNFLRVLFLFFGFRTCVNSFIPSTDVYLISTMSGTRQVTGTQPWTVRLPPCPWRTENLVRDSFTHSFIHSVLFIECLLCAWHCSRDWDTQWWTKQRKIILVRDGHFSNNHIMYIIIKCNKRSKEILKTPSLGFYTQLNYHSAGKAKQRYFQMYNK